MKQGEVAFFLAVRPLEMGLARKVREVQMLYRVDGKLKLLQAAQVKGKRRGQIMGIDTVVGAPVGDVDYVCRQVRTQVEEHGYGGICCSFSGNAFGCLAKVVEHLSDYCRDLGLLFLVSEGYGEIGTYSKVLVSTALSGGDIEGRFRRMGEKYGRQRVMMDIEPMGEDFLIPSPKGTGEKRTVQEIRRLGQEKKAQIFFSKELCARYFTYENGENSLRFVLFDDEGTIQEKMRLAKLWELSGIVATYEEIRSWNLL